MRTSAAPGVLDAGQIAGLYRALRKGREDIKDEPGAAAHGKAGQVALGCWHARCGNQRAPAG